MFSSCFMCVIMPVEMQPVSFHHVGMGKRGNKLAPIRSRDKPLQPNNFCLNKNGSRAGRRHARHDKVCAYEISGQMRSDNRMRSCQTQ